MPLDDAVARAQAAKEIARDSLPRNEERDPRDTLADFDQMIVGGKSVIIKLPLRDPVEVRRHLAMIEETVRGLRLRMQDKATDRSHLFTARGVLRQLHQKLNAYRTPRKD